VIFDNSLLASISYTGVKIKLGFECAQKFNCTSPLGNYKAVFEEMEMASLSKDREREVNRGAFFSLYSGGS
jgi:hypothetical protein